MKTASRPRLLTVADVAERCLVPESTVRYWIHKKRIPYVKVGRRVRIEEDVLEALIDSGRRGA